jgi:hypothetical protein
MLWAINDNIKIEIENLDEREVKMIEMCKEYYFDPFGCPNHLLMILVAKLWNHIVSLSQ